MLTNNFFSCLTIFLTLIVLGGCGAKSNGSSTDALSNAATDSPTHSNPNNNSSLGCSADGSHSLVPGTYIFQLSSSVSSKQKTQVKIFKSDCRYCFETVTEGDSTALSSDGTWTSKLGTKDNSGQEIDVIVAGLTYTISGSGQTLSQSSSVWGKTITSNYTCE